MRLTLTGADLHRLFAPLLPHLHTNEAEPGSWPSTIQISTGHHWIYFAACNPTTTAVTRHPAPGTEHQPSLTVPGKPIASLLAATSTDTASTVVLDLDHQDTELEVHHCGIQSRIPLGRDDLYPDWARLFTDLDTHPAAGEVVLNAALLARFAPLARYGQPLQIRPVTTSGSTTPIAVLACGGWFRGAVAGLVQHGTDIYDLTAQHWPAPWTGLDLLTRQRAHRRATQAQTDRQAEGAARPMGPRIVWRTEPPPGQWVCGEPHPDTVDQICGTPVDFQPCPTHSRRELPEAS